MPTPVQKDQAKQQNLDHIHALQSRLDAFSSRSSCHTVRPITYTIWNYRFKLYGLSAQSSEDDPTHQVVTSRYNRKWDHQENCSSGRLIILSVNHLQWAMPLPSSSPRVKTQGGWRIMPSLASHPLIHYAYGGHEICQGKC